MKIVNTGSIFRIFDDDLKTYNELPVGTYGVNFSMMGGFFLEKRDNISINEKIYGVHREKAKKVLTSYKKANRNLGVILSGNKGIGKSLTAKLIAIEANAQGLPVIIVDKGLKGVASYISSIQQECVVIFDEFEKMFKSSGRRNDNDGGEQDEFLTLFDGLDQGKKLFVVTCNSLSDLSDFMVNRPGRFHYHFRFNYPTVEEIREYLTDKLYKKYHNQIDEVVSFSGMTDLNYDCLRAIAFELNMGTPFKEAIKDLNITNYDNDYRYDVTCVLANGLRSTYKNCSLRLEADKQSLRFNFPQLHDTVYIEFDPSMRIYDSTTFQDVCGKETFAGVYWDRGTSTNKISNTNSDCYDADDYDEPECCEESEEPNESSDNKRPIRPEVIKIFIHRKSNYHNIHYAF